ncbi:MAG: redoxin domain-containing protein [Candidatus Sedimenticola sp. 20ELBAFRAG]
MNSRALAIPHKAVAITLLMAFSLLFISLAEARELKPRPAPEFTHQASGDWLNSAPISISSLKGKVVLLDFWTFDCWNCYRSFPWLHSVEEKFGDQPFQVIGIHTPEFQHERKRKNVEKKIGEFKLTHPVMMDNDFSYWNATGTRYWPSFYLVDKQGRLRHQFIGETHAGDKKALNVEQAISSLLAE